MASILLKLEAWNIFSTSLPHIISIELGKLHSKKE